MSFTLLSIISYVVIGALAGIFGALLGIGGGAITVPSLLLVFSYLGFPHQNLMHLAIGTSLASMVINTFSATYFQHRKKSVVWLAVARMILGIVIGSIAGNIVARALSSNLLAIIFGVFACILGISFIKPITENRESNNVPNFFIFTCIGITVAFLANILGLGGGFFMVPIFFYFHLEGKKAIGTSSATSFLISLCGAIGYVFSAQDSITMPLTIGFIYIPAFILISLTSLVFSYFGVKLAHSLPINTIRRIFAVAIIAIGLVMIFK